jgi:hypothetical protein
MLESKNGRRFTWKYLITFQLTTRHALTKMKPKMHVNVWKKYVLRYQHIDT